MKKTSQPVPDLELEFDNLSNEILSGTEPYQMRNLLVSAGDTIVPATSVQPIFYCYESLLRDTNLINHSESGSCSFNLFF